MTDQLIAVVWVYDREIDRVTLHPNRKDAYATIRKDGDYKQGGQDGAEGDDYWDTSDKHGEYIKAIVVEVEIPDGYAMISKYV